MASSTTILRELSIIHAPNIPETFQDRSSECISCPMFPINSSLQSTLSFRTLLSCLWNSINYNPSTMTAVQDPLDIGDGTHLSGVTCQNCYAFLGAGFLAIFEYNS